MNMVAETGLDRTVQSRIEGEPRTQLVEHRANDRPLVMNLLTIARRRKWLIAGVIAAVLVLGLVITLLMTPKYTASVTLEIQREGRNFTMVQGAESQDRAGVDLEFYQTQYGLLQARSLADRVATQLKLYDDPAFFAMFGASGASAWFENGKPVAGAPSRDYRVHAAGDILLKQLSVEPERLSRLVTIRFTTPDAALSKRIVDAWGGAFIQLTMERRFETTAYARRFLEGRLSQLRLRIDDTERRLVDYAAKQGIVNLPSSGAEGAAGSSERSIVAEDLVALNREAAQATADRVKAESRLGSSGSSTSEALDNTAISGLRQKRAEVAGEYARLMVQFEPDYPPARSLKSQLDQLDRSIAREEGRVGDSLKDTYTAALERESDLKRRVTGLKTGVLDLRRRSIQYNIYQRDVDTNRQLYDALLQRYKEIGVAGGVGVNNISVVDQAELPEKPSSPKFLLNIIIALFVGGLLGFGAAVLIEQIDQGISDPNEIEPALGVPLIGTIPKVNGEASDMLEDRKSILAEAYTSLRTTLMFSTDHGLPRTLAVSSTRPAEGKSTTSFALALSIARSGRKVVLVDGDMRSPSLHYLLGIENAAGFSNYLSSGSQIGELIRPSKFDGLSVITAGPQPPSAAELLVSDRFEQFLTELLVHFDQVVIDAPPVMGLADAPLIASRVDGTIFVIETRGTQQGMARVAIDRLVGANAQILGALLTKFDATRAQFGYGYDYGYGYGYGNKSHEQG